MEKRAVVLTEKEKKANQEIKKQIQKKELPDGKKKEGCGPQVRPLQ